MVDCAWQVINYTAVGEEQVSGRHEEAQEALQIAYERLAPKYPWGYFHYLDGPPAAGGGVSCFAWFESRDPLFAFIAHHQAWICAPEADTALAEKAEQVQRVIARLQAEEIDMEQARLSCLLTPICDGLEELDVAINGPDKQEGGEA